MTYTIGEDIISQTDNGGTTKYLLYDGHGSTRQLLNHALLDVDPADGIPETPEVTASYSYDAYGTLLGGNPTSASPTATSLLYTGEHFDEHAQQYYLRARYYDPLNGRFNRTDPHPGSAEDPQSLHKYLYCHANPVNAVDPNGLFATLGGAVAAVSIQSITYSIVAAGIATPKFFAATVAGLKAYFSYLGSMQVWILAARGVAGAIAGLLEDPVGLVAAIAVAVLSKAFAIIGIAEAIWDIFSTSGVLKDLLSSGLPANQVAFMAALMTATLVVSIGAILIIGKALGLGRSLLKGNTEESIRLYRAVDDLELEKIESTGRFEYGGNFETPTGEPGKFFWGSMEEAQEWVKKMTRDSNGREQLSVVSTTVDSGADIWRHGGIVDGIGDPYFVKMGDLVNRINLE